MSKKDIVLYIKLILALTFPLLVIVGIVMFWYTAYNITTREYASYKETQKLQNDANNKRIHERE